MNPNNALQINKLIHDNLMMATTESKISVSWCDSAWIPFLNQSNVMD